MTTSRRRFLGTTSLGLLGVVVGGGAAPKPADEISMAHDARRPSRHRDGAETAQHSAEQYPTAQNPAEQQPGQPPTFGTGPAVGPEVSPSTFAEAEKLVQVDLNSSERELAAGSWRQNLASLYERRTGPRKVALEATVVPATQWNPVLPGQKAGPERERFVR